MQGEATSLHGAKGSRRFESLSGELGPEGKSGTRVPPSKDENSIPYEAEPYKVTDGGPA